MSAPCPLSQTRLRPRHLSAPVPCPPPWNRNEGHFLRHSREHHPHGVLLRNSPSQEALRKRAQPIEWDLPSAVRHGNAGAHRAGEVRILDEHFFVLGHGQDTAAGCWAAVYSTRSTALRASERLLLSIFSLTKSWRTCSAASMLMMVHALIPPSEYWFAPATSIK